MVLMVLILIQTAPFPVACIRSLLPTRTGVLSDAILTKIDLSVHMWVLAPLLRYQFPSVISATKPLATATKPSLIFCLFLLLFLLLLLLFLLLLLSFLLLSLACALWCGLWGIHFSSGWRIKHAGDLCPSFLQWWHMTLLKD